VKASNFACEDAYYFLIPGENPSFWVSHAGITRCDETYRMSREGASTTVIEYVYSGTGTVELEGKEYHPSSGDIYILPERSKHTYYADRREPWTKIFINLKGTAVNGIVQAFGLHKKAVYHKCEEFSPIFEEIYDIVKRDIPVEQVMEKCAMLVMKLLIRLHQHDMQEQDIPDEVQTAKRFIDNNYRRNLTMDDIAASVYRSNDYVKKRFKHYYGMTPYAYYLDVKMTHAKYLLQRTSLSVKQIADSLGFKSDRYFSKRFRELVGMTATQYRKNEKNRTS
jgi:AraC-like DNA-binding protein